MDPVRTCVGCRRSTGATELLRVAWDPSIGALRVDVRRRLGGRGAWLHASPDCLDQALRRRAFGRALRRPVASADLDGVAAFIDR